jgi:hypothetical protein
MQKRLDNSHKSNCYNENMKKGLIVSLTLICLGILGPGFRAQSAYAQELPASWGAYLERLNPGTRVNVTFLVPPSAELIITDHQDDVYKAIKADQTGKIIIDIADPGNSSSGLVVFYSDGSGLSSSIPLILTQNQASILLAPTIYGLTSINEIAGSLGFIGKGHPSARVMLEITLSTNEIKVHESLANNRGEWQIISSQLPPGKHKARAMQSYMGIESGWSQEVVIAVLNPTDRLIQDLGSGTRRRVESVIDRFPDPIKSVAKGLDQQSNLVAKFVLPTLFTLAAVGQSGILAQNLLYILFQALLAVGQAMGIIKKKQPIGMVYDSITKRPIGRAIVRIYEAISHRLVETDVTSAVGTFSFMPPEGYYYLRVIKPGYMYPSQLIASRRDGRYSPVYTGGDVQITTNQAVVNVAVPLDPEVYQEKWYMRLSRLFQKWYEPINQWLLWLGLFLAFLAYTRDPGRLNFMILWLYCMGLIYFWWQGRRFKREFGVVVNARGKPVAGVELVLTDVEFNRLVSRRVTDAKGRFQFITPPGNYVIKVVSTAWEMVTNAGRCYQGNELKVAGDRGQTKHLVTRIAVRETA